MSKQPFYKLDDFFKACSDKQNVGSIIDEDESGQKRNPLEDARKDFNLNTLDAILDFISNGGLEDLKFQTTTLYRNRPELKLMVDSYEFKTCGKLGYIAFLQGKNGKWLIKSLHLSEKSNTLFDNLFKGKEDELKKLFKGGE